MDPLITGVINFQQAALATRVDYAVARKILDSQQSQGNAALKLVQSAESNFNKAGDALVAAATGLGGNLDTYA